MRYNSDKGCKQLSQDYYIKVAGNKWRDAETGELIYTGFQMEKYADGWAIRRDDINVGEFKALVEQENNERFDEDGNLIED